MIIAVNGTNLIHADWFASKSGALDNFIARLLLLRSQLKPLRLIVAWDHEHSFRRDLAATYKGNRPAKPPQLASLLIAARQAVIDHEVDFECVAGFEADDVLASIAHQAAPRKVALISGDKDLCQCLVAGRVTLARKVSRAADKLTLTWETAATFERRVGVKPEHWCDVQTLCGDSGDRIAGIQGVGEGTAVKWVRAALARWPNQSPLGEILRDPWSATAQSTQRDRLRAYAAGPWRLTRQLVELRTDVPLRSLGGFAE